MLYFSHDTSAANDSRIEALRITQGGAAVDAYWVLLEMMYKDEKPVPLFEETNSVIALVSHRLLTDEKTLATWVNAMLALGLFKRNVENIFSERAMETIAAYHRKAETARQNGKKGGRKPKSKPKANPAESESKANKKEITKVISIEEAASEAAASSKKKRARCPHCKNLVDKKFDGSGKFVCTFHGVLETREVVWL